MKKNILDKELLFEHWGKLLGDNNKRITVQYDNKGILEKYVRADNGKAYGIIKHGGKYFIKESTSQKKKLLPEDFHFIGVYSEMHKEAFTSYNAAVNRLALKVRSINEAVRMLKKDKLLLENKITDNEKLVSDLKKSIQDKAAHSKEENELEARTAPQGDIEEPQGDIEQPQVRNDKSNNKPSREVPVSDSDDDVVDDDSVDDKDSDSDDVSEKPEGDKEDKEVNEILSDLAKLGQALQSNSEKLSSSETKQIINSLLGYMSDSIAKLSDKDKDDIKEKLDSESSDSEVTDLDTRSVEDSGNDDSEDSEELNESLESEYSTFKEFAASIGVDEDSDDIEKANVIRFYVVDEGNSIDDVPSEFLTDGVISVLKEMGVEEVDSLSDELSDDMLSEEIDRLIREAVKSVI